MRRAKENNNLDQNSPRPIRDAGQAGNAVNNLLAGIVVMVVLMLIAGQCMKRSKKNKLDETGPWNPTKEYSSPFASKAYGSPVSPELFKTELIDVENLLYASHPAANQDAKDIEAAVSRLVEKIQRMNNRQLRELIMETNYFGENVGAETDVGIGIIPPGSRQRWIDKWEFLVRKRFFPASWLKGRIDKPNAFAE